MGIEIVRRSSGGGSIYTDKDQLIFSIITHRAIGVDVEESFKRVCNCLISALEEKDIKASYKPPNDILINGKKVSGSAQVKKRNAYIIHSTLILDLNENVIDQVLRNHKPGYISSIKKECGFKPKMGILKIAIKEAIQRHFDITFRNEKFSNLEKRIIHELMENKYGTHEWNFKR